ncbi:unnamed protein product, partial [marine sediment metagenome]
MGLISNLRFMVDNNVGKLAKWLRIMGMIMDDASGTMIAAIIL